MSASADARTPPRNPIVLIPARMASQRLPGKPLTDIAGRPMIVHVLERAEAAAIGPVIVACGEPEIADAVERIRFEHPGVKVVVLTSAIDRVFSSGANILMLGASTHAFRISMLAACPMPPLPGAARLKP